MSDNVYGNVYAFNGGDVYGNVFVFGEPEPTPSKAAILAYHQRLMQG